MAATGQAILDDRSVTSSSHVPDPRSGGRVETSRLKTWPEVPLEGQTMIASFQSADLLAATASFVSPEPAPARIQKILFDAEAQISLNMAVDLTIPIYSSAPEDLRQFWKIFEGTRHNVEGLTTQRAVDPHRSAIGLRVREIEWWSTHQDELRQYAGEWVVLEGEEIITHGLDLSVVVAEARVRGIAAPYVLYVEVLEQNQAALGL